MPTSEDDVLRQLIQTFRAEAADHLQTLNQALLQLERETDEQQRQEKVQEAFRAAHSLKGAARAVGSPEVGAPDIEAVAHDIENVLQEARDHHLQLTFNLCDVLYDGLDAIEQLLNGQAVDVEQLHTRLAVLTGQKTGTEAVAPQESFVSSSVRASEDSIRVTVGKLDDLMAEVGELLVSKVSAEQRLTEMQALRHHLGRWPKTWREIKALLPHINGESSQPLIEVLNRHHEHMQAVMHEVVDLNQSLSRDTLRLGMVTNRLQSEIRRVRMVPFETITLVLQRTVRDVAHAENKQVNLTVVGSDVELDKKVLETLKDPLVHLLRNAVGHGIETADERTATGKVTEGHVSVIVRQRGGEVRITVLDDGRGFDLEALRDSAARQGHLSADGANAVNEAIALAFLPGVSTASEITEISGRGVGLDVVRQCLEVLQGRIQVESTLGSGTNIQLIVPVSLAMTRGLLVRVGTERYVLPLLSVEKIIRLKESFSVEGQWVALVDGRPLPLVPLLEVLKRPKPAAEQEKQLIVIMGVAEQRLALLVDDVLTEQELTAKPLPKPLHRVPNITGSALLGSGEPVLILNAADLIKSAKGVTVGVSARKQQSDEERPTAHILIVDDSITTRTLEKNILEAAGYQVVTATDGVEALKRLKENEIQLVVADVQMPQMDGISLTRHLRESGDYNKLPVILVTSLESREDRERGMLAGADAYIIKRGFDQAELLTTIQNLL